MAKVPETMQKAMECLVRIRDNMAGSILGKPEVIERVLIGLAAGGHVLIEDLPGLGKTTLAYSLARSIDCAFSRIQFTSDLLPSDVTGVSIYDERQQEFLFKKGPVFANVVLADEINRATPKTQSALLEVMDRGRVTIDGEAHVVGSPFMVFATQNPVDYEGAFPLPESQMDRFLLRVHMGYPGAEDEMRILRGGRSTYDAIPANPVATRTEILGLQAAVPEVYIEETVLVYLQRILAATRTDSEFRAGASVRAGLALKLAAQARALFRGRDYVMPEDIARMVPWVLSHRLSLQRPLGGAFEERRAIEGILERIVQGVEKPL